MIKRVSAAVAVSAFGLALGAGASFAGDQIPCGTPGVPAGYDWVVTQPAVAEVSHLEHEWARQTAPEQTIWHWQRTTTTTIYQWKLWVPNTAVPQQQWSATSPGAGWVNIGQSKVVVTAPAVTKEVTSYEFRKWNQKDKEFFGDSRWSIDPKWNANDNNGKAEGWEPTGATRTETVVVTPPVTVTQFLWEEDLPDGEWDTTESATSPGEGWEQGTAVSSTSETENAWSATKPEGDGWVNTQESRTVPATYEYRWAATSPGGEWTQTEAEPKKVVDVQAVPEQKEWQVVTPAVPAGEPCVEEPPVEEPPVEEPPVEEPPVEEPPVEQPPVEQPPVDEEPVDEPTAPEEVPAKPETKPVAATPKPASAIPQIHAAVSPTRLAHTGTDLTLLWTGLGLVVVGAGLGAGYRKVSRES